MIRSLVRNFRALFGRSLDAAGGGRRWSDARPVHDAAQTTHLSGGLIGARAEHYVMNSPHGWRIVESLQGNLVGTGALPRSGHPDPAQREALAREFSVWTDVADADGFAAFYGMQANVVRDLAVRGEALLVWASDPTTGAPQLRRLHPEQLDRSKTQSLQNGGAIIQGVERSADGRTTAYWICPRAPGDALAGLPLLSERHPASEVIHVFRPLFPGQVRGLSWFTPILLAANELAQLQDAMLVRAKTAAMFAGYITDPEGDPASFIGTRADNWDGVQSIEIEPGLMGVLPPGKQIEFSEPPDAGNVPTFMDGIVRMLAVGAGLTYEQLSGDYSKVNYSSARAALLEFRRFAEGVQHHVLIFQFCRPVWDRFILWQVLKGTISAQSYQRDRAAFHSVKWLPPAWPWVDPLKDAQAAVLQMNSNIASRSEIVGERGYDIEQLDREIADDTARAKRLGISPVETPQLPAKHIIEDEGLSADEPNQGVQE